MSTQGTTGRTGTNPEQGGFNIGSKQYQSFYKNAPLSFQSLNSEGFILDVNTKWCSVMGYDHSEVIGTWFGDYFDEKGAKLFNERFEKFKKTGSIENVIFHLRKKDNTYIDIDFSGTIGYSPAGDMIQTYCVFIDITHQKEIEGKLKRSSKLIDEIGEAARITEEKYRYYLELSPTPIFIANSRAEYTYVNKAACELTEYSCEKLLSMRTPDLHFGTFSEAVEKDFKDLASGRMLTDYQTVIKTKNNQKKSVIVNTVKLPDDEFIAFVTDISNVIDTELALSEREATITGIFKVAPIGIWLSVNREFVHVNPAICKILGYEMKDLLGNDSIMVFPSREEYDRVGKLIDSQFKSGNQDVIETVFVTKSGIHRDMQVNMIPLDSSNRDRGFVFTALDITDAKKASIELLESERRLNTLIGNLKGLVYRCKNDEQWTMEFVSDGLFDLTGYLKEDIIYNKRLSYNDIILPDDRDYVSTEIQKALKVGERFGLEYRIRTVSGDIRWVWEQGVGISNDKGELNYLEGFITDITDKKEAEKSLIRAKEKAEESDRLKSSFLQNMSHELRTPMNGIVGFIELLKSGSADDPKREEYFDTITNCSNQLINIVNDILDISKIETGQVKISISAVSLGSIMEDLQRRFLPLAKSSGLVFDIETCVEIGSIVIDTDEEKLKRIFNNIISNALKFTDKGSITIFCEEKTDHIRFNVSDTGVGIDSDESELIFQRFRQADGSIARKKGGAGLGLAISKGLVELLGGTIGFESEPGVGTTFTFTLPYNKEATIVERVIPVKGTDNSDTTILIVEDGEFNRYYLKELLSKQNYSLMFSENGEDAIEICKSSPEIDLVLMDIKLPGIDGFEATRVIKEYRPDLIVIAQTAYAMASDRVIAVEAGCDDYISKPIDAEKLLKMLKSYN
jgi:hypothetical protein